MIKLSRKVLCLDWDARSLRMVVARLGGGQITLEDAHSHRLPKTVDPENPQALGEYMHQMLRRHHWHFRSVIVDVPREKAVINRLSLPPTPVHEVAAAVRFQAMKELPFPLDNAAVDYVIMRRDDNGMATEVLLAAVPRDALETVRATCEAAGLTPARVGLRPYANLVSVQHLLGLAEQRVLFVDVGPTMTEIDIMADGQLAFARSANVNVPMPSDAATEDSRLTTLADVANLDVADDALEAAVREVSVEITRTLQAYRAADQDAKVDRILIAGGTGAEAALLGEAERRFGLPSELFNPTSALQASPDEATKLRSFSAALGLAWGLSRDGALAIDFLNPKKPVPPRAVLKRRLRIGAIAAVVVVAAALATNITLYMQARGELERQQLAYLRLKEKAKNAIKIENLVEEVEDWQADAIWVDDLLWLTEQAVNPGKDMLVQQMTFDARQAKIDLKKVMTSDYRVPMDFVARLNEFTTEDGERPYLAKQGALRPIKTRNTKFEKAVDIEVQLPLLKKHLAGYEKRVKDRKRKLKEL